MTRIERAERAPLTWSAESGGRRGWVCFDDDKTYALSVGSFEVVASRMMAGDYYPTDVVRFEGNFRSEGRGIRVGDRVLQSAPLLGRLGGPVLFSAVEVFVAERTEDRCCIGYVTTSFHFGRGIWSAELTREGPGTQLRVKSTASPQSWLFWLGLPVARYLQLRARRRAVEEFRALASRSLGGDERVGENVL